MIALTHLSFSPCLSRETPRIVKFLSLNLLKALTTFGFSLRQGPHQLAQKSTSTYFPRSELSDICFPVGSGIEISGAMEPTIPIIDFLIAARPWCCGYRVARLSTMFCM